MKRYMFDSLLASFALDTPKKNKKNTSSDALWRPMIDGCAPGIHRPMLEHSYALCLADEASSAQRIATD
jgi:hypothetical protein